MLLTEQVNAQCGIESRCGKHAETLDHAEILGWNDFHAHRTDKHHGQCDSGADTIGTTVFALGSCDDDHGSDTMDNSTTKAVVTMCITS